MTTQKIQTVAKPSHVSRVITAPHIERDANGQPIFVFGKLGVNYDETLVKDFKGLQFQGNARIARSKAGLTVRSKDRSFGYKPKRPVFGLPGSACLFNNEYPRTYRDLTALGQILMDEYLKTNPKKHAEQKKIVEVVRPHWFIPGTFFTQGIINNAVSLEYHFDRGNFKSCWSCMAVFKKDILGGDLVIPDLDVMLKIEDHCYLLFDGQSLLHGVTPIIKQNKAAYRFSVVFYAIELMKNCADYDTEIKLMGEIERRKIKKRAGL